MSGFFSYAISRAEAKRVSGLGSRVWQELKAREEPSLVLRPRAWTRPWKSEKRAVLSSDAVRPGSWSEGM